MSYLKMKYKLSLDNGEVKFVDAPTKDKAIKKFLGTRYHEETESYPERVEAVISKVPKNNKMPIYDLP